MMPKGASSFFVLVLVVGAVFLIQRFQSSGGAFGGFGGAEAAVTTDGISVYFSPRGGCEAAVVSQINGAAQTVDVQAYSFTSNRIAHALAAAHSRGVRVRIILDKKATDGDAAQARQGEYLQEQGVPIYIDGDHPIAHDKIVIVDGSTVVTGSFNFTKQAENENAENLLVIAGRPSLAAAYEKNFELHLSHSPAFDSSQVVVRRRDY
jgi:phosphatidylserine/phosphatidylglycerophosphate/cardiolipin synthase-like enzyme